MNFQMSPLPEVFVKTAWGQIAGEIDVPAQTKRQLFDEVIRQHNANMTQREAVRAMMRVLDGVTWRWPRCEALLLEEGEECTTKAMLEVLYHWLTMAAQRLHRRGQIRAVLSSDDEWLQHEIVVGVWDGETAPCGRRDGDILQQGPDIMKAIPPCKHLRCSCDWMVTIRDL